ncbi:MAG: HlyD family secretion protein [Methyloceanibacter sp.]|uniref:HlyD family secretion protein n=1 Tax=Methyloceanibacter sp. TaxID=1965321 RepID=UPI003EDF72A3
MGSNPRDFGNLAEILDLEPSDALEYEAQSRDSDFAGTLTGAGALQARLAEQVRAWDENPETALPPRPSETVPGDGVEPGESAAPAKSRKAVWWRVVKTLVAFAAVIALGWTPLQRFLQTTSAEATVNARLVTLRAPIDGTVTIPARVQDAGTTIDAGMPLLNIDNPRADRAQLDTLRRQISGLESERQALTRRKAQLQGLQGQLREQRDAFQKGRVEQLDARVAELTAEIAGATAKQEETESAFTRATRLKENGWQTDAALDKAERDHKVAVNMAESLRQKLIGTRVELDAARRGLFVGDSYNDIPRTAQRLDEVKQQVIDLDGEIDEKTLRIAQLQSELTKEEQRFTLRSAANLTAPVPGRIWEVLTSDGEQVSQGQELIRVLDCGGVLVSAAVSEAVYNSLKIGQPATFHLRGESEERQGRVAGLHGLAAAPANLAIQQTALAREPYHVSVEVPNLATGPDCHVGRTGKVTFNTSAGSTSLAVAK